MHRTVAQTLLIVSLASGCTGVLVSTAASPAADAGVPLAAQDGAVGADAAGSGPDGAIPREDGGDPPWIDAGLADTGPVGAPRPISRLAPESTDLAAESAGGHPALVLGRGRWVLFWERRRHAPLAAPGECTFGEQTLMATEISLDGAVLGPAREVAPLGAAMFYAGGTCGNDRRMISAIARGDGFLVAWRERQSYAARTQVALAVIDGALGALGVQRFDTDDAWFVAVAGDAASAAIVWDGHTPHQQLWFATVGADGARGPRTSVGYPVFPILSHQIEVVLAWDGRQYGLAFESDRERLARCGCDWSAPGDPVEVFLMRLSPEGRSLGLTRISDGIEEGLETRTGVNLQARSGGGFHVAWIAAARGGADVAFAQVDADGGRGPIGWASTDGAATEEGAPQWAGADGRSLAFGFGPPGSYGIRVAGPAGTAELRELTPPAGCEPHCFHSPYWGPNQGDLRLVAAAGPSGEAYAVWPTYGGTAGTSILHGAPM